MTRYGRRPYSLFHVGFLLVHALALVNAVAVVCHLGAVIHHGRRTRW